MVKEITAKQRDALLPMLCKTCERHKSIKGLMKNYSTPHETLEIVIQSEVGGQIRLRTPAGKSFRFVRACCGRAGFCCLSTSLWLLLLLFRGLCRQLKNYVLFLCQAKMFLLCFVVRSTHFCDEHMLTHFCDNHISTHFCEETFS